MGWWNSKKKEALKDQEEVSPIVLAGLAIDKSKGENNLLGIWSRNLEIPSKHKGFIGSVVLAYQYFIFFDLIEERFGTSAKELTLKYLIVILNSIDEELGSTLAGMLDFIRNEIANNASQKKLKQEGSREVPSIEKIVAFGFLYNFPDSPSFISPANRDEKNKTNIPLHQEEIDFFTQSLLVGSASAEVVYIPILDKIKIIKIERVRSFEQVSISFLIIRSGLIWSQKPACFENFLLLKFHNPIFGLEPQNITQNQIDDARDRDLQDIKSLKEEIDEIGRLIDQEALLQKYDFFELREKISFLLRRCLEVGGISLTFREYLLGLKEITLNLLKSQASSNQAAYSKIEEAIAAENKYLELFDHLFICQLLRKDKPFKTNEIAPVLLSQDLQTIKNYCRVQKPELIDNIKTLVNDHVCNLRESGQHVGYLRDKLDFFGINYF